MAPFPQTTVPAHLNPEKCPLGRPSEYRPEYCKAVQDHMAQGYSLTAFAGSIRVSRDAVYGWIRQHAAFSDAVARGRAARTLALEVKLLRARYGAQASAAIFALKNAQPDEWRDVKTTEHNHHLSVETLTDAQLFAIAGGASPSDVGVIDGQSERIGEKPATG